jgi:hypothetical protein
MESFALQVELFGAPTAITALNFFSFIAQAKVMTTGPSPRGNATTSTQVKKTAPFVKSGKKPVTTVA